MMSPAKKYLTLRSLGAPAVLLSLAMQGVFRGFKDTKTPLYATGKQNLINYFPLYIYTYMNEIKSKKNKKSSTLFFLVNILWIKTVAGDLANIILDPIFIFVCRLGVSGAAIAHVLSQ